MSNISDLAEKVEHSLLTPEEKTLWKSMLSTMSESDADATLYLLENTSADLLLLTEKIQEKLAALKSGDRAQWKNMIANDKAWLAENQ